MPTASSTAVLLIDPYNDFTSALGKGWPLIRAVANKVHLIDNLKRVLKEARRVGIPVVYAPHQRYRSGKRNEMKWPSPSQLLARRSHFFADERYGGRFRTDLAPQPGEFVASEHAVSSGFGGTNLDEHLRSIGVQNLVICGLLTNTCVESTLRQAVDLGYAVTVISDGVAAWSHDDHAAALDGSLREVAHAVVTAKTWVGSMQ